MMNTTEAYSELTEDEKNKAAALTYISAGLGMIFGSFT